MKRRGSLIVKSRELLERVIFVVVVAHVWMLVWIWLGRLSDSTSSQELFLPSTEFCSKKHHKPLFCGHMYIICGFSDPEKRKHYFSSIFGGVAYRPHLYSHINIVQKSFSCWIHLWMWTSVFLPCEMSGWPPVERYKWAFRRIS